MAAVGFLAGLSLALVITAEPSSAAPSPAARAAEPSVVGPPEAGRIVAEALRGNSYAVAAELTDLVGARLAGSPGADAAVRWGEGWFRRHGLRVWLEPVQVNRWVRGEERGEILSGPEGRPQPLSLTALGHSGATPPGGVVGEVVEVTTLEELRALGPKVKGKVVLFQHDMKVASDYGRFSPLRTRGPAEAARLGAAAALVRSLSTATFRLPHTGTTIFPPGVEPIPAAAVAVEDAELVHRLLVRGPVRVRVVLGGRMAEPPMAPSANVVAEIRGAVEPDAVVVIGAHLDSWDLGTGAIDDAAGVAMVLDTLRIAAAMPRPPRRTLRAVLFMNEENGAEGAAAYFDRSAAAGTRHVAAMEADSGAGRASGVQVSAGPGALDAVRVLAAPLATIGIDRVGAGGGGVDISPLAWQGVPLLSLAQDTSRYFDWHHTAADTLDKIDRAELAQATAAFAWMAWALADAPDPLPRQPVPLEDPWWKPPRK